jgi:hypothetical protein
MVILTLISSDVNGGKLKEDGRWTIAALRRETIESKRSEVGDWKSEIKAGALK